MSVTTSVRPRAGAALVAHLREPMRRASYALIISTAATSGLGLLFWFLAARWLSPAEVGIGAALVTASGLLANIATLGLRNGLIRFLPEAGGAAGRLLLRSYGLCAVVAVASAAVFVLGQPWWAAELGMLRASPLAAAAFCLGTAVLVLAILQDNALTGLHRAGWVPVSNALSSVAKVALLPGLGLLALGTGWAVFAASVLPSAFVLLVVTALVLRRLPPAQVGSRSVPMGRLVRFAASDHLAALLWMSTSSVLTLMVLQRLGPEASAYFYLAALIAYAPFLVTSNISSALLAEGARSPERVPELVRAAMRNAALLVLPAVVLGILLARPVLGLFGSSYAEQGTLLLQLELVAAVPQVITGVALAAARLRQDLRTIVLTYLAMAAVIYAGSWLAIGWWGLPGVGLAGVVAQVVVALGLLVAGRSGLGPPAAGLRRWSSRRALRARLAPALVASDLPAGTPHRLLASDNDTLVVAVDPPSGPAVLKIATSAAASAGLDRHAGMLTALADGPLASLVPTAVATTQLGQDRLLLETRRPGATATPADTGAALAAIAALHRATATSTLVGRDELRAWVDLPLERLRRLPAAIADPSGLDRLAAGLRRALSGQHLTTGTTHGDFWTGNVLVGDREVTGIVDWENAERVGLPEVDLAHWWLSAQPVQIGTAVRRALADPAATEAALDALPVARANPQLPAETVVLLAWLGHVGGGLARAVRSPLSPVWAVRNVRPVVGRFAARPMLDESSD